jgi:hypothetical protein
MAVVLQGHLSAVQIDLEDVGPALRRKDPESVRIVLGIIVGEAAACPPHPSEGHGVANVLVRRWPSVSGAISQDQELQQLVLRHSGGRTRR